MALSDAQGGTGTQGDVEGATLIPSGPPQITRITLPTCRAQYPGGPGRVHMSVASPLPRGLPRITGGSASATSLSRPAQASLELRPVGSLNRPRRPLSQGFDPSGYPDKPPASYQIKPTTVWMVPSSTSDTRLLGARGVEERRGGLALWASLRFLSPLIKPDVRISRIRLPDRLHLKAHGGGPRWTRLCRITPSSPNTTVSGKRLVPRDDTLWRLTRK